MLSKEMQDMVVQQEFWESIMEKIRVGGKRQKLGRFMSKSKDKKRKWFFVLSPHQKKEDRKYEDYFVGLMKTDWKLFDKHEEFHAIGDALLKPCTIKLWVSKKENRQPIGRNFNQTRRHVHAQLREARQRRIVGTPEAISFAQQETDL